MILNRRELLAAMPATLLSVFTIRRAGAADDDSLHLLKPGNIERLRMDFNASRSKVRLLFLLSPT